MENFYAWTLFLNITRNHEYQQTTLRIIFVQPQFSKKAASLVAKAINGSVIAIDPLASDYIGNLQTVSREISGAMQ